MSFDFGFEPPPATIKDVMALVRGIGLKLINKGKSPPLEIDDLVQIGMEVATPLFERYDRDKGDLLPFIYPRVRGAMLDALAKESTVHAAARDMNAGAKSVLAGFDGGNAFDEDAPLRLERHDRGRFALAAAFVLGVVTAAQTPEDLVIQKTHYEKAIERVREILPTLPVEHRTIIEAHHFDGITIKDAAEKHGMSYDAAQYAYEKGLELLGKRLSATRPDR